jgi:hypothetical protein
MWYDPIQANSCWDVALNEGLMQATTTVWVPLPTDPSWLALFKHLSITIA